VQNLDRDFLAVGPVRGAPDCGIATGAKLLGQNVAIAQTIARRQATPLAKLALEVDDLGFHLVRGRGERPQSRLPQQRVLQLSRDIVDSPFGTKSERLEGNLNGRRSRQQ